MLLLSWFIVLPFLIPIEPIRDFWIEFAIDYFPSMAWILVIIIVQELLARYVLLQDAKLDASIDNRRFYNLSTYFFYFNVSSKENFENGYTFLHHFLHIFFVFLQLHAFLIGL